MDIPVYDDDGNIQGWESVTADKELHQVVADRNKRHLNQAKPTPFRHGEGYDLLHGENRCQVTEDILAGELQWKHPMKEVNEWVDQLKTAYDADTHKDKAAEIDKPITNAEFRKYFKSKKESTESSPLQRHVGHYKAALASDDIVTVLVAMLNIGMLCGVALPRWKRTVSIMLEKDKGRPKLNRL